MSAAAAVPTWRPASTMGLALAAVAWMAALGLAAGAQAPRLLLDMIVATLPAVLAAGLAGTPLAAARAAAIAGGLGGALLLFPTELGWGEWGAALLWILVAAYCAQQAAPAGPVHAFAGLWSVVASCGLAARALPPAPVAPGEIALFPMACVWMGTLCVAAALAISMRSGLGAGAVPAALVAGLLLQHGVRFGLGHGLPELAVGAALLLAARGLAAGRVAVDSRSLRWLWLLVALVAAALLCRLSRGAALLALAGVAAAAVSALPRLVPAWRRWHLALFATAAGLAVVYRLAHDGDPAALGRRLLELGFGLTPPGLLLLVPLLVAPLALAARGPALVVAAAMLAWLAAAHPSTADGAIVGGIALLALLACGRPRDAAAYERRWWSASAAWAVLIAGAAFAALPLADGGAPLATLMGAVGFDHGAAAGLAIAASALSLLLPWRGAAALPLVALLALAPARHLAGAAELKPGGVDLTSSRGRMSLPLPRDGARAVLVTSSLANGASVAQGTAIGRLLTFADDGSVAAATLRAGEDTAEWAAADPRVARILKHRTPPWHVAEPRSFGAQHAAMPAARNGRTLVWLPPGEWTRVVLERSPTLPEEVVWSMRDLRVPRP